MKNIKVNADYESVLINPLKNLPVVNETIEFLAFFIQTKPIITHKKYSKEYFSYIEEMTGHLPRTVKEGEAVNWWGELRNIELEKKLNSKELSASLNIENNWSEETHIVRKMNDLPSLHKTYLAKSSLGMSGKGFSLVEENRLSNLEEMIQKGPVILEPLLKRTDDFSFYVFPNNMKIAYENFVDTHYQYRGTLFTDYTKPFVESFRLYESIPKEDWDEYKNAVETIISSYRKEGAEGGFSIDSFLFETQTGSKKIKFLSEVNYRRTMGAVAFDLCMKFGGLRKWGLFLMTKASGVGFSEKREILKNLEWRDDMSSGVVILSPGDTRYDMYFLSAKDATEGGRLFLELKKLLPNSEFAIKL